MKTEHKISEGSDLSYKAYNTSIKLITKELQRRGVSCAETVSGLTIAVCLHLLDLAPDANAVYELLAGVSNTLQDIDKNDEVVH